MASPSSKPAPKSKRRVESGVCWPLHPPKTCGHGGHKHVPFTSTSASAIEALLASYEAAGGNGEEQAALRKERRWRFNYPRHFFDHVKSAAQSPKAALAMARGGMDYLTSRFRFVQKDGKTLSLGEAMSHPRAGFLQTFELNGGRPRPGGGLSLHVPYAGQSLSGAALVKQLEAWKGSGVIEPSCVAATRFAMDLVASGERWDTCRGNHAFVVLGAGAAIGPTATLLSLGATVVAVDLHGRPWIWKKLAEMVQGTCGRLVVPVRGGGGGKGKEHHWTERAGADLLTEGPEVAEWLARVCPDMTLTVGCYGYLDGQKFVRIAMAMDAIATRVVATRPRTSLAFLASPSDIYLRPEAASKWAGQRFAARPAWMRVANVVSFGKFCAENRTKIRAREGYDLVDGTVTQQGPNYMLAKRLQQWRSILARASGTIASINIAPASATRSVTHNTLLRTAYKGMSLFEPCETFMPDTTNAVMTAALLRDVFDAKSPANPVQPLAHPMALLADNAWHGGVWTTGMTTASSAVPSAVAGLVLENQSALATVAAVGAAVVLRSKL